MKFPTKINRNGWTKRPMLNPIKKRKILRLAKFSGCYIDGDVVIYKGTQYFVHYSEKIVCKVVDQVFKNVPWHERLKINGTMYTINLKKLL